MDMETLKMLTDLKYRQSLSELTGLMAKETELRGEIDRLRQLARDAQTLPVEQPGMQHIGADVIWLRWVSKTISALNVELAQILAQMEALRARQRHALGRKSVADALATETRKGERQERAADQLKDALEHDLMARSRPGRTFPKT